jgi:putative ABC transport system permease protein
MLVSLHGVQAGVSADETRPGGIPVARRYLAAVRNLPPVIASAREGAVDLQVVRDGRIDERFNTGTALGVAPEDDHLFRSIQRLRILRGREPLADRADEIALNPELARLGHWHVGSIITEMKVFPLSAHKQGEPIASKGIPLRLTVVGIVRTSDELLSSEENRDPRAYMSRAFAREYPNLSYYEVEFLRLRHDVNTAGFRGLVEEVAHRYAGIQPYVADLDAGLATAQRSLRPQESVLWVLGAVGVLATVIVLAQGFAARVDGLSAELRIVGAMGLSPRAQRGVLLIGGLLLGIAAAAVAVVAAVLLSPLGPVGAAREAEPDRGIAVNVPILALGALAIVALLMVAVALPARRVVRSAAPGTSIPSHAARAPVTGRLTRWGVSGAATFGLGLALDAGQGRVRQRTALVAVWLTVLLATAAALFATALFRLTNTPDRYGWAWSAAVGTDFGPIPSGYATRIAASNQVTSAAGATLGTARVGGDLVSGIGIDQLRGSTVFPTITAGRLPQADDEVVLGARTLARAHSHIGEELSIEVNGQRRQVRVVGTAVFPELGSSKFDETALGRGLAGRASLFPQGPGGKYNYVLVRVRPGGVAPLRAQVARFGCPDRSCVVTDGRPTDISGYAHSRSEAWIVVGGLAVAYTVVVAHAMLTALRRRRRDLALLKAIGMTRRSVTAAVVWQSAALAMVGAGIGVPLGTVLAHWTWARFAVTLGVPTGTVAVPSVLALSAVAVAVLTCLPMIPGSVLARRTSIAQELRATN